MAEKLLITQALDERDLLEKKINSKIRKASFVDMAKNNEENVVNARVERETFKKQAESSFQQIQDLIKRYQKIDAAIVASNASTVIQTSYGEYTVAGAISLRNRLRNCDNDTDFEGNLLEAMEKALNDHVQLVDNRNRKLETTAEGMRTSILGKDTKTKDDKPLEVVDTYVKENTTVLVDPLDLKKKIEETYEKRDTLLRELDTAIKVSNATTFIEI